MDDSSSEKSSSNNENNNSDHFYEYLEKMSKIMEIDLEIIRRQFNENEEEENEEEEEDEEEENEEELEIKRKYLKILKKFVQKQKNIHL